MPSADVSRRSKLRVQTVRQTPEVAAFLFTPAGDVQTPTPMIDMELTGQSKSFLRFTRFCDMLDSQRPKGARMLHAIAYCLIAFGSVLSLLWIG